MAERETETRTETPAPEDWRRVASGDYETVDGRFRLWRLPDVYPPAWNVERLADGALLADGARTMRDAIAIAASRLYGAAVPASEADALREARRGGYAVGARRRDALVRLDALRRAPILPETAGEFGRHVGGAVSLLALALARTVDGTARGDRHALLGAAGSLGAARGNLALAETAAPGNVTSRIRAERERERELARDYGAGDRVTDADGNAATVRQSLPSGTLVIDRDARPDKSQAWTLAYVPASSVSRITPAGAETRTLRVTVAGETSIIAALALAAFEYARPMDTGGPIETLAAINAGAARSTAYLRGRRDAERFAANGAPATPAEIAEARGRGADRRAASFERAYWLGVARAARALAGEPDAVDTPPDAIARALARSDRRPAPDLLALHPARLCACGCGMPVANPQTQTYRRGHSPDETTTTGATPAETEE